MTLTDRVRHHPGSTRRRLIRLVALAAISAVACDGSRGYEVIENGELRLAVVAQAPSDTLPSIHVVGDATPYPCARILPGAEASWQGDTLLVTQREADRAGVRMRVFCIPYNVPARTEGVESTSRVYPAQPNGELPGYAGWVQDDPAEV
jgi:hypothetical protein